MRKHSIVNMQKPELKIGTRNWLLHARYVRGEHAMCMNLADELQNQNENSHRYAHFVKGLVLADAGRYQEALDRFHICIRLHPHSSEPLKNVAKCLFNQERYQLSLEAYLEADKITKYPNAEIYCALAECSWHLGNIERGIEWARAAVQAGGGERAGTLLAKLLVANEDVNGALQAYDKAMESEWCSADTLAGSGALRLRCGSARLAFQQLGAALALQPRHHAAALALAAMLLQHRDVDAALARLKAALSAHPTCVAAHTNLGLALLAKKKYVAAVSCCERASRQAALSAGAALATGLAMMTCRRAASAFCRLAAAAALQPDHAITVLLIGIALERLGDSRADAAYQRAVELSPNDALIRLNAAARHARCGRLNEAIQQAEVTTAILIESEKPSAQLASATSTLLELLKEAGERRQSVQSETNSVDNTNVAEENNNMLDDEV